MNIKNYQKTGKSDQSVLQSYAPRLKENEKLYKAKTMNRRAVSDIIAVLLLLGITVAGAVLISTFFSSNKIFQYDSTSSGTQTATLKITGYDTRDGTCLSGISTFDNSNPTNSVLTAGSEYIVLNIMNQGFNKLTLQGVEINDITHTWDTTTKNLAFPGTKPAAGMFSILPTSSSTGCVVQTPLQKSTSEVDRNGEVKIVVRLSSSLSNIGLNEPVRVKFYTDKIDQPAIIITSGGVR